jgi:hypothetical protein
MMMSLDATLGFFLLLAGRNPSAHRSLIGFAAWSSFAHATVMSLLAIPRLDSPEVEKATIKTGPATRVVASNR